jgi:hypothetical protein
VNQFVANSRGGDGQRLENLILGAALPRIEETDLHEPPILARCVGGVY